MIFKKFVKKYFYVLLTLFSVINILFLKNLIQKAYTVTNSNIGYQISVNISNTYKISQESIDSKNRINKQTSDCLTAFKNDNQFLLGNSTLINTNRCFNYLSSNGFKQEDWVQIVYNSNEKSSQFFYNYKYLYRNNLVIKWCEYATIWHNNDFQFKLSETIQFSNGTSILNVQDEFFYINCKSTNNVNYETAYARILAPKLKYQPKEQPINVLLLGLDSVSRNLWLKSLPVSSDYLINGDLKATVLNSYNIVGDGTPAALIPMLTSKHEHELPDTNKYTIDAKFVDEAYPFIWNDFNSVLGYATMFAEDWPSSGTLYLVKESFLKNYYCKHSMGIAVLSG
jgi:hypothetical protein